MLVYVCPGHYRINSVHNYTEVWAFFKYFPASGVYKRCSDKDDVGKHTSGVLYFELDYTSGNESFDTYSV